MATLTRKVTLTEGQWDRVRENAERDDDWDVVKALDEAETVGETRTYKPVDQWAVDARKEGREL